MYTSIGPVLIAVNPYKQLSMGGKGIYTSGVRDYYHRKVLYWIVPSSRASKTRSTLIVACNSVVIVWS